MRFDQPGEQLIAESGAMVARDAGIEMKSSIQGGLGGALKRRMHLGRRQPQFARQHRIAGRSPLLKRQAQQDNQVLRTKNNLWI